MYILFILLGIYALGVAISLAVGQFVISDQNPTASKVEKEGIGLHTVVIVAILWPFTLLQIIVKGDK